MKYIIITIVAVLGLSGLLFIAKGKDNKPVTPTLSIQTIQKEVANGGQLVDVRTLEEFAAGHIEGAVNIPLQDIEQGKMPSASKSKTVYVYCRSGNRSAQAKTLLQGVGYQTIIDLGSMANVESLGGKVIKS